MSPAWNTILPKQLTMKERQLSMPDTGLRNIQWKFGLETSQNLNEIKPELDEPDATIIWNGKDVSKGMKHIKSLEIIKSEMLDSEQAPRSPKLSKKKCVFNLDNAAKNFA